jgi:hypothetical protein
VEGASPVAKITNGMLKSAVSACAMASPERTEKPLAPSATTSPCATGTKPSAKRALRGCSGVRDWGGGGDDAEGGGVCAPHGERDGGEGHGGEALSDEGVDDHCVELCNRLAREGGAKGRRGDATGADFVFARVEVAEGAGAMEDKEGGGFRLGLDEFREGLGGLAKDLRVD